MSAEDRNGAAIGSGAARTADSRDAGPRPHQAGNFGDPRLPDQEDDDKPLIDTVLPDADPVLRAEGWRLHVFKDRVSLLIANERVHPEKVADPHANHVAQSKRIFVHNESVEWLRDQLTFVVGDACARVPLGELQAESARTNEANGVIAFLAGVLAEVAKADHARDARTLAMMGMEALSEWHAGMWKPGAHDDPADWRRRR